ncbi:MAG: hypothetical protein JKY86_06930 [Gammaproteobacteria bacterium]|nr:hypothetical protein [Gammaproteobacteria bacterium]
MESTSTTVESEDSGVQAEISTAREKGITTALNVFFDSIDKYEIERMSEPLGLDGQIS